jgi:class 3 adenylate cyclase
VSIAAAFGDPESHTSGPALCPMDSATALRWSSAIRKTAMERRLAAILVADMAGYSRLMEQDGAGVLERQKAHRAPARATDSQGRMDQPKMR